MLVGARESGEPQLERKLLLLFVESGEIEFPEEEWRAALPPTGGEDLGSLPELLGVQKPSLKNLTDLGFAYPKGYASSVPGDPCANRYMFCDRCGRLLELGRARGGPRAPS